ncbi:MAG: NUDIX hydrolase [Rubrobacteraceae bacterium]
MDIPSAPHGTSIINLVEDAEGQRQPEIEDSSSWELAERLRGAVSRPFPGWREVYEGFSPVDLVTGELRPRTPPPDAASRRAAVLVPVLMEPGGARLVYTVRKGDLQDHAGQISFPGGSFEPGDGSLLATALREAEEEIDLSPDLVEVIGKLEEMYIPPSNFRVSPFVGLLTPEADMVLAPDEVEEIFSVSLEHLMEPTTLTKVIWHRDGRDYEVPVFAVEPDSGKRREIWGATAAITAVLLARLGWSPVDITGARD